MNKKGIEISVNFMVMLIIALVVFGLGLKLAFDLFGDAQSGQQKLSAELERELLNTLTSTGSKVAIPEGVKKLKQNEYYALGVGIYNVLNESRDFYVKIEPYKYYANENSAGEEFDKNWTLEILPEEINPYKREVLSIPVKSPKGTKRGTYIFNVDVCDQEPDSEYDSSLCKAYSDTHQMTINIY